MDRSNTLASAQGKVSTAFYSKVWSLFGLAILVTGLGVYAGFHAFLPLFLKAPWSMFALFGVELLLIFTSGLWSRKEPLNYFLFSLFTFLSGITLVPLIASFAAEFGSFDIIYRALFSTTVMFLAFAVLGARIKKPLMGFTGFLTMGLIGLLVVSLIGIFFPWGNTGEMLVSGFGVLLFAGYAIVDVNRLRYYDESHYINAAMQLYLDVFNLFIFILRLSGALSRD